MPTITTPRSTIAYEVVGTGETIILGSSFLMTREMWRPQIDHLARNFRLIAVDWPGHGESGPIRSQVTLDDLVDDFVSILDAEGVDSAVWAGLSLGGMVAIRAALRTPHRVRALILVDTDADAWHTWERLRFRAMGLIGRTLGMRPLVPSLARIFFAAKTRRERPDLIAHWRDVFRAASVPSVLRILNTLASRESMVGRLGTISAPALVLHGANDAAIPPSRGDMLHRGIPGSRLRILDDCGHIASLDQPAVVNAEMEAFLRDVAATSAGAPAGGT